MKRITSRKKLLLYGCSGLGVNMMNIIMGSYLCSALLTGGFEAHLAEWTYLEKDLVVAGVWAVFVFFAKALDGVIDLPFATFADRLHTGLGRRKTGILIGFLPMLVAYLLFLVPLASGATVLNTVWFGVLLCIFYTFYTLTMLTYYATFSEVCESEKDTQFLSNTKSICDVVYFSLGFALIPLFISLNLNIRIIALIFLPLSLSMLIPFFLLKEGEEHEGERTVRDLKLGEALSTAFKNKPYIVWMCASSVMTIGLQLFLGGINEVFSSIESLNMTVVMASSFAPVPLTIIAYNRIMKRRGLGTAYRFVLVIFAIGMGVLFLCNRIAPYASGLAMNLIAIFGGIFISFAIGAFFSVSYSVPTTLAQLEVKRSGKNIAAMLFAVQGLFEGIAAGIATGGVLVLLKSLDVIALLPIVVILCCVAVFFISFLFPSDVKYMGKEGDGK